MRALSALAASLTIACAAAAQTSPPAPQPQKITPEQIASARQEGDILLQTARAQDLFDNETGLNGLATIMLRHKASGFICQLNPGAPDNNVIVYPNPNRGDDVGCNTSDRLAGTRTTNFTRDGQADELTIGNAGFAIKRRFPDAQPAPDPTTVRPLAKLYPNVAAPQSVRFLRGAFLEEDVSAHVDGWLVEDRFTAPLAFAQSNTLDMHWYATVSERQRHNQAKAVPAPTQTLVAAPSQSEDIALARNAGDRILRSNQMEGLFDNITDSNVIRLRHRASGLVCGFDLGEANAVLAGPGPSTSNRADAINCLGGHQAFTSVLTLIPNPDHRTADQALADTLAITHTLFGELRPFAGKSVTLKTRDGAPARRTVQFLVGPAATPIYFYVSASAAGDWILVEQVRGPTSPEMVASMVGELTMITAIGDLTGAQSASGR
jgi:hypothetical protein